MAVITSTRPGNQVRQTNEHNIIKQEQIVALAVPLLASNAWLPQIFTTFNGSTFKGAMNDTVTMKLGRYTTARDYEWRTRLNPTVADKIGTTFVSITLNQHTYSQVAVTNEQLTLDITNYGQEILAPQIKAIIDRINLKIITALAAAPLKITNLNAAAADKPSAFALKARRVLNDAGVPQPGRFILCGTNVEDWMLSSDELTDPQFSGGDAAIKEATLGRLRGFNIISGSSLIGDNDIYVGHRSGLLVANVAPEVPIGSTDAFRASGGGFSLLGTRDYVPTYQQSLSTVSTFTGVSSVNDEITLDSHGMPTFDSNGDPVLTNLNVRIAKGVFTPAT
jgi:hypothetical protein